jgi:hypothetical protein
MRAFIAALLLCAPPLAPAQDDAKIKDLIRQLDGATVEEREEAFQSLVKLGAAALPALREAAEKSDSGEVRVRAKEALAAIDLNEKAKLVYREPKLVTLNHDGTLRAALEEIAQQAGVKVEMGDAGVDAKVAVKLENVPVARALDALCQGRDDCTWEERDPGVYRMLKEKHAAMPAAYIGPFRVRIKSMSVERRTDFKGSTIVASFDLEADYEKHLKPMGRAKLEITKLTDDTGREVAVKGAFDEEMGGIAGAAGGGVVRILRGLPGMGGEESLPRYYATGLSPEAKGITSLKGTVTWRFPLAHRDVAFDAPATGDTQDVGDFKIKIKGRQKEGFTLSFSRAKEGDPATVAEEVDRRLDTASVVAVDSDGKEYKADSVTPGSDMGARIIVVGGAGQLQQDSAVTYRVSIPGIKGKEIKTLKLRFVDKTLDKAVPFEISGVKFP